MILLYPQNAEQETSHGKGIYAILIVILEYYKHVKKPCARAPCTTYGITCLIIYEVETYREKGFGQRIRSTNQFGVL